MTNQHTHRLAKAIIDANPKFDLNAMAIAKKALVDFLACAFGGSCDPSLTPLLDVFASQDGGPATLIGLTQKTDRASAALINGYMGHVLDFDDVQGSIRGHPTTVIIPALLAVVEGQSIRADDFLAAYIVGLETMARLGLALGQKHYEKGFHATATLGAIGAAAAIAHLFKFDEQRCAIALGQAASQAAGLRLQFGTDTKPLHAGLAARAGLTSALLAKAGLQGSNAFLDGPLGFLSLYAFGNETPHRAYDDFGKPWQIVTPGLTFKPFPCCTASFPVAVGALDFHRQGLKADNIASVTLTFPHGGDAALICQRPQNGIDARFSPEYVFAAGLIDGRLTINHFGAGPLRPDIAQLATHVTRRHDEHAPRLSPDPKTRFVVIDIALKSGSTLTKRIDGLPHLEDPNQKFRDCIAGNKTLSAIPELINHMEDEAALKDLVSALAHVVKQ